MNNQTNVSVALQPYQVDHLLLLVGSNPLPNAVAARLLSLPVAHVYLLYTKERPPNQAAQRGSFQVAQRLQDWLGGTVTCHLKSISAANAGEIYRTVGGIVKPLQGQRVGLHYTGGTKAMAVHAYRAVEVALRTANTPPVFSYLDANTLQLRFDPPDPASGQRGTAVEVSLAVRFKLERDLLKLHGWELKSGSCPRHTPLLPRSTKEMASFQTDNAAVRAWLKWRNGVLKTLTQSGRQWKNDYQLKSLTLPWPNDPLLVSVVVTLQSELGQTGSGLNLGPAASHIHCTPTELCEWLYFAWLEHYVLYSLQSQASRLSLSEHAQNIKTHPVEFQVDVVALRGYQLFAFSCSTDSGRVDDRGRLKRKLLEALVRARQLGGDEARVALVCTDPDPLGLQQELRHDFNEGEAIRVFGQDHLLDLPHRLAQWIES